VHEKKAPQSKGLPEPRSVRLSDVPDAPPPPPLIAPFVRQGDTCWLVGEPGSGKTGLAADMLWNWTKHPETPAKYGHQAALPDEETVWMPLWADTLRIDLSKTLNQGNAAILDAENDEREWLEAVWAAAAANGHEKKDDWTAKSLRRLHWFDAETVGLDQISHDDYDKILDNFVRKLVKLEVGLLVIDPIADTYRRNLNDPEWITDGLALLRRRLRLHNITTVILAHPKRMQRGDSGFPRPLGSSKQESIADTMFSVVRDNKSDQINLVLTKCRAGKWNHRGSKARLSGTEFFGGYKKATSCTWTYSDPRNSVEGQLSKSEKNVLAAIPKGHAGDHFAVADIKHDYSISRKHVTGRLMNFQLVQQVAVEDGGGTGARNSPHTYALTQAGALLVRKLKRLRREERKATEEKANHKDKA
jgi:KaiC/GvpD/RAD55 family RecA-like ATPase